MTKKKLILKAKVAEPKPLADLSVFQKTVPKSTSPTHVTYPPDDDDGLSKMVEEFVGYHTQLTTIEGAMKVLKSEFRDAVLDFYFRSASANPNNPPTGVLINGVGGDGGVLVQMKDKYRTLDNLKPIAEIAGAACFSHFHRRFEISINSELIPEERQDEFVKRLHALTQDMGCPLAVSAKEGWVPNSSFHKERHAVFTPEMNRHIEDSVDVEKGFMQVAVGVSKK